MIRARRAQAAVLGALADGQFHSGSEIGAQLGKSRAAVHKTIGRLAAAGVEVERVRGRGYRLPAPIEVLDEARLATGLADSPRHSLTVLDNVDSTSDFLLRRARHGDVHGHVCMAETQRAGRGRRGRGWFAAPYRNLLMSLAWCFEGGPASLTGLSLAAGVVASDALAECGAPDIFLKWPNDILCGRRKLGGILVDLRGETGGPTLAVVGIGINLDNGTMAQRIDQPWTDLRSVCDALPGRNDLAVRIAAGLLGMVERFSRVGLGAYRERWLARHADQDRPVVVEGSSGRVAGLATGIDENGALLVQDRRGVVHRVVSGELREEQR